MKYDSNKLPWSLLPWKSVEMVVQVLVMGAKKYAPNSWQTVPNASERYWNAMMRHAIDWKQGERLDPESGINHLGHVACNALFLIYFDTFKSDEQDDIDKSIRESGNG